MILKIVDIGYGWKVQMKHLNDGTIEFIKYRNKSSEHSTNNDKTDSIQFFNDSSSNALTEFFKFIERINDYEESKQFKYFKGKK